MKIFKEVFKKDLEKDFEKDFERNFERDFRKEFWLSKDIAVFINPRRDEVDETQLRSEIEKIAKETDLSSHVFMQTSGSTQTHPKAQKWVALHKDAFLASAKSVNDFLGATQNEHWLCMLPIFHVGGLSQFARAYLANSQVFSLLKPWSVQSFFEANRKYLPTYLSLVPTQMFDLIVQKIVCPTHLKKVFIGGSALQRDLQLQAIDLGWPLVLTYGMTETCSQVAYAIPQKSKDPSEKPDENLDVIFNLHPHSQVSINESSFIKIESSSLYTGQLVYDGFAWHWQPRLTSYFLTEDKGAKLRDGFIVKGREIDFAKVLGENVSLLQIEQKLKSYFGDLPFVVVAESDLRKGHSLIVVVAQNLKKINSKSLTPKFFLEEINDLLLPFERIDQLCFVDELPINDMGKVSRTKALLAFRDAKP